MNVCKNARLTPSGRALMAERMDQGWSVKAAAQAAGVSIATAHKWRRRHRLGDARRHNDRSSAPRRCRRKTPELQVAEIERLRRQRMTGLRIAPAPGMAVSTVGAVLRRLGLGKLADLDPKPEVIRYERSAPGEMIHLDIKKLGRFDIEGHRVTGDRRSKPHWHAGHYVYAQRPAELKPVADSVASNPVQRRRRLREGDRPSPAPPGAQPPPPAA